MKIIPGMQNVLDFIERNKNLGIESTGASVVDINSSTALYNVSGSTFDPKRIPGHYGEDWKPLLIAYGVAEDSPCYANTGPAGASHPGFNVGGHVTTSKSGIVEGGICYLMPLCHWHNNVARDHVAFNHTRTKMLELTGYQEGELAATFQLRLPSQERYAVLYFADDAWQFMNISEKNAANLKSDFLPNITGDQSTNYVLFERIHGEQVLHHIREVNLPGSVKWNQAFSNLIRQAHANVWGNWELDAGITVGAVGYIEPDTGSFVYVTSIDASKFKKIRFNNTQDWTIENSGTHRSESAVNFEGGYLDPSSGVKVTVGTEVKWGFSESLGLASNASVVATENIDNFGVVLQDLQPWLAKIAQDSGFGDGTDIAQGFGVITSTIIAAGVVNVGSQEADNYFTLTGSVDGVAEMTGDGTASAKLGGSYKDTNATKSAESHIYPSKANTRADGEVTIAYNFASFDGTMLLPSWVQKLDPLSITFDNAHGGTYIADITVTYDYETDGKINKGRQTARVSGGCQANVSGIPLNAVNLYVQIHFVAGGDKYFSWRNPVTAWLADNIVIDLSGVWWGAPHASVRSR